MCKLQLLLATVMLAGACSSAEPRPTYVWNTETRTQQVHPAVACSSPEVLDRFERLSARGTAGDRHEEATLLGESALYASDTPPDPPCQRVGVPNGPIRRPAAVDQVKDVEIWNGGIASFRWTRQRGITQPDRTYFTFPEYIISARNDP